MMLPSRRSWRSSFSGRRRGDEAPAWEVLQDSLSRIEARLSALEGAANCEVSVPVGAVPVEPVPATPASGEAGGARLSRRRLISGTGVAVAGGLAVLADSLATASPAVAASGQSVVLGASNDGGGGPTIVTSTTAHNIAVLGVVNPKTSADGLGLFAQLGNQSGLAGGALQAACTGDSDLGYGVVGTSNQSNGVYAYSNLSQGLFAGSAQGEGISAYSGESDGIFAQSGGSGVGVVGQSSYGDGVNGRANGGNGVYGDSSSGVGVRGRSGTTDGVYGLASNANGVHGVSTGGAGVRGESQTQHGVVGTSTSGYGVAAKGGLAQLWLSPASKAGKPTTGKHQLGELYLDSVAALFICTKAGTPGTWAKVSAA